MKRKLLIRRLVSVAMLTAIVTGVSWIGLNAKVFTGFQRRATDALFPAAPLDERVVVVGIDRESITATQDVLPWDRSLMAKLTDQLAAAGAAVIAFDVVFAQPSQDDPAGDAEFAAAIERAGNVVLGEAFSETRTPKDGSTPVATSGTGVFADFATVAAGSGHVQVNQDPADGVVRSVPLVFDAGGQFVPALSLAAVATARGVDPTPVVRPEGVQVGDRFIPTERSTAMRLNWTAKLSDPPRAISAIKVLDGTIDPKKLAAKVVFVGATDPLSGDLRLAPTDKSGRMPGVYLHANAANTMLTAAYLEPAGNAQTLLWVAILSLLVGLAVVMLPLWLSPILALILAIGYVVVVFVRLDKGTILNLVYPLAAIVLAFVGAVVLRYFGETRQRRRVTALFSQYVPESVAQRLVDEDRAELAAGGQRLDMTVLFCDLRGFTAMSENLPPATVRVMLDHYYDRVTELVLSMRGTLMKYVGDEVFAVWGAPIPSVDHPELALRCAMAIQALTPELNAELLEKGAPEVSFGIGLNTGEAVAAHFGGGRRRQYDVVGDTVNVGARLCSQAGRGDIILSDQVLTRVPDPPQVEPVGPVEMKGVSRELVLWRVTMAESCRFTGSGKTSGDSGRRTEAVEVLAGASGNGGHGRQEGVARSEGSRAGMEGVPGAEQSE